MRLPPTALGLAGTWRPSLSSHTLAWDALLHPGPRGGGRELVTHVKAWGRQVVLFVAPLSRGPSLPGPWMKKDTAMAVGQTCLAPSRRQTGRTMSSNTQPFLPEAGLALGCKGASGTGFAPNS